MEGGPLWLGYAPLTAQNGNAHRDFTRESEGNRLLGKCSVDGDKNK
jgi:hypothetical protein